MKKYVVIILLHLLLFSLSASAALIEEDANILEPTELKTLELIGNEVFIYQVAASGDSLYAYMTDGSVCVWDAREDTQRVFCELPTPPDVDAAQYDRLSAEERRALDGAVSRLAEGDDALYSFNVHSEGAHDESLHMFFCSLPTPHLASNRATRYRY